MAEAKFPRASAAMLPHINSPRGEDTTLPPRPHSYLRKVVLFIASSAMLYCIYTMLVNGAALLTVAAGQQVGILKPGDHDKAVIGDPSPKDVPDYFQTTPQLWPGPTRTGQAPFLGQTNTVSFASDATYVPSEPLETAMPIVGDMNGRNIFEHMGHLSPYFPNPVGFGVDEYPLPKGANITMLQMISRHGSRYPEIGNDVEAFAQRIANASGSFDASDDLSFLNDWTYQLGHEILVPKGRQELYDSGVLHYYKYGKLYNPNTKILARTTTQDRMLKSAEIFMAGFFGLEWTNNATLLVIIEHDGSNNTLAGYNNCPNSGKAVNTAGKEAGAEWASVYLKDATKRFQKMVKGYEWTLEDTIAAQTLCPYETVAFGFSIFCDLFTYSEWKNFAYSIDLLFSGGSGFHSPVGRAVGLGYVQETLARLTKTPLPSNTDSQINITLNASNTTFPLDQTLYFDFSHDSNILSVLTAFGLNQLADDFDPKVAPGKHNLTISHVTPFASRLDIEVIRTPSPIDEKRKYIKGPETEYVHFILNQRTLPLGWSLAECGLRKDGWCELETFVKAVRKEIEKVDFEHACFGNYTKPKFGEVRDGMPVIAGVAQGGGQARNLGFVEREEVVGAKVEEMQKRSADVDEPEFAEFALTPDLKKKLVKRGWLKWWTDFYGWEE